MREEADGAKREEESEKKRSRSRQFGLLFSRLSLPSLDSSIACRSLLDRREHDAATVTRTTSAENECGEREENEGDKREREREREREEEGLSRSSVFGGRASASEPKSKEDSGQWKEKRNARSRPAPSTPRCIHLERHTATRRVPGTSAAVSRPRKRAQGEAADAFALSLSLSLPSVLARRASSLLRSVGRPCPLLSPPPPDEKKTSRSPTLALSSLNNAHGDKVHLSCSTFSGQREYERARKREGGREGKGGVLPLALLLRTTGVASLARGSFDASINRRNKKTPLSPHSPRARARPCRRWERSDR